LVVMDEDDCMVDIAKFFMEFTVEESCGKCTPCRIGNKRVLEMLQRITSGKGTLAELRLLKELSEIILETSLCGLGKTATNPVLSSMYYFEDEYLAHVEDKVCIASVCKDLLKYYVTDDCIGCGLCKRKCPVSCISGTVRQKHFIDHDDCIKCNTCLEECPVDAIVRR
ncbi:MAG: 4Fe-4S binding protein, partial [Tissierellia bacterium]|nr:4Fe-4S binding protein [Tissierellia bacterium]